MLTAACQKTLASIKVAAAQPGRLVTWGDVAAVHNGGAIAIPGQAEKLYEAGFEHAAPLHRLMSKDDVYGCILGAKGVGPNGLVYRCALRELEGAYAEGKQPSLVGLPAYTGGKPKKRKADEPPPPPAYTRPAVPAAECLAAVGRLRAFAAAKGIDAADVWTHAEAATFEPSAAAALVASEPAAAVESVEETPATEQEPVAADAAPSAPAIEAAAGATATATADASGQVAEPPADGAGAPIERQASSTTTSKSSMDLGAMEAEASEASA